MSPVEGFGEVRWNAVERSAVGPHETECAVGERLNGDAAFVHGAMMMTTQQHEVGGFRLAAVRPVLNVMGIDIARVRAPWKAATPVTSFQCAAERWRNAPGFLPDIQRFALFVLE